MPDDRDCLPFEAARHCWRVCQASRASVLVDAAAYFRAARRAILGARTAVYVAGWDLHSATSLIPDGDARDRNDEHSDARTLRDVLARAVRNNPDLRIYLLLWDWAVLYAAERELLPQLNLDWRLPESVRLQLDSADLVGASQHQKLLVIDDEIAFCGGLDLTVRRWDRRRHAADEPARVDHKGEPYAPYHDVQLAVTGEAAVVLGDEARRRWHAATGETLTPPHTAAKPDRNQFEMPEAAITLTDIRAAVARTLPARDAQDCITEVRDSLLAMIASAREYIYIENQFVCADVIGRALAERLQEAPGLEVLMVTPRMHKGWLESRSMGAGRARFMQYLADADVLERTRLAYPVRRDGDTEQDVFVHAKVMIVDGRVLRIGSANLNNRSMGYDSECDVILMGEDDAGREGIASVLHDLLAEHLGAQQQTVADAIARHGLLAAVRELSEGEARLETLDQQPGDLSLNEQIYINLADPEQPVPLSEFLPLVSDERKQRKPRRTLLPLLTAVAVVVALGTAWRYTPLSEMARPESLQALLQTARESFWTPLLVVGIYVLGGFAMLPVTGLVLATGVVFDTPAAMIYAAGGALLSATGGYAVGRYFDFPIVRRASGGRWQSIARAVRRRGVLAMATVRNFPAAPFMVVNVLAGAARIRFRDYILGTAIGMGPGIVVITAFGQSLGSLLAEMSWTHAAQVAALALLWIALLIGARRLVRAHGDGDDK